MPGATTLLEGIGDTASRWIKPLMRMATGLKQVKLQHPAQLLNVVSWWNLLMTSPGDVYWWHFDTFLELQICISHVINRLSMATRKHRLQEINDMQTRDHRQQ